MGGRQLSEQGQCWDPPHQQVLVGDQEAALRLGPLKSSWFPFKPGNWHLHSPWALPPTHTQGTQDTYCPSGVGGPSGPQGCGPGSPSSHALLRGSQAGPWVSVALSPGDLWSVYQRLRLLSSIMTSPCAHCPCTVHWPPLVTIRASLSEALWFSLTQFRETRGIESQRKAPWTVGRAGGRVMNSLT